MFLLDCLVSFRYFGFLRASGGVSAKLSSPSRCHTFSPRKRRCFRLQSPRAMGRFVFSAQAEVFLTVIVVTFAYVGFLRASGGVSISFRTFRTLYLFSPRKRRCFCRAKSRHCKLQVFSAQAEVFLRGAVCATLPGRFLRASGGVSLAYLILCKAIPFSPRKRRCFSSALKSASEASVFSAQAEVFLIEQFMKNTERCFLRARGGVSWRRRWTRRSGRFSPRKRRCF